ncbi:hypothetical protein BD410DRAFT_898550 [Rickenella mellea]|uniref:TPR-like protein n=1 Tax=Rickenella mellea TaxID=50990 RepID=A0A4Y7Q4W5_9AGAM|nr:hypothetical protein BD410DRAFT_898550 [Rickenella mellea]
MPMPGVDKNIGDSSYKSHRWKVFLDRGIELARMSNYEGSLVMFNQAANYTCDEVAIFESRAGVLEQLERYEEALEDCRRVVDLAPNSWMDFQSPPSHFERYGALKRVRFYPSYLRSLFIDNFTLEAVICRTSVTPFDTNQISDSQQLIALPYLRRLELPGLQLASLLRKNLLLPSIEILCLRKVDDIDVVLSHLQPFTTALATLHLDCPTLSTASLITFLQAAPSLVTVELSRFEKSTVEAMDALAGRNRSMICPNLTHFHFTLCPLLSAASVALRLRELLGEGGVSSVSSALNPRIDVEVPQKPALLRFNHSF